MWLKLLVEIFHRDRLLIDRGGACPVSYLVSARSVLVTHLGPVPILRQLDFYLYIQIHFNVLVLKPKAGCSLLFILGLP